jgi:hypothetical protein
LLSLAEELEVEEIEVEELEVDELGLAENVFVELLVDAGIA